MEPTELAKHYLIRDTLNERGGTPLKLSEIYVVWFCYILGGWKALLSTTSPDGRYYEVTYDNVKMAYYVDTYEKAKNTKYTLEGETN